MHSQDFLFSLFIIFTGAAILSTLALFTRQSMLVAYLILGMIAGPWGLKWVSNPVLIQNIGEVGISFLLFLLGLHLQPKNLLGMFRKTSVVALVSSLVFFALGSGLSAFFGYNFQESCIIGAAFMFSSTIIGLKLLPTTILHHQHTGEVMISVLLLQDMLAIAVLLTLYAQGSASSAHSVTDLLKIVIGLPALIALAFLIERFVLIRLLRRFDQIREYIFLLSIGWCLSMAQFAHALGISSECGAFIAGVVLAEGTIALYIAENLKPLRDFFLVLFFFATGALFNFDYLPSVGWAALVTAILFLVVKPVTFSWLLRWIGEQSKVSWEVGVRLGQASEFSLLVAYIAASPKFALIRDSASYYVQAATILTFVVSSYWVVWCYPTPVALTEAMRRD